MVSEIMDWVQGNTGFRREAGADFAQGVEAWLVAYAEVHGAVLVTDETYQPGAQRKVKLPNVCRQFGVAYRDTFEMLRELEVRFDWTPS